MFIRGGRNLGVLLDELNDGDQFVVIQEVQVFWSACRDFREQEIEFQNILAIHILRQEIYKQPAAKHWQNVMVTRCVRREPSACESSETLWVLLSHISFVEMT